LTFEASSAPILTRTILPNDAFNEFGFSGIDDIVRPPQNYTSILLRVNS